MRADLRAEEKCRKDAEHDAEVKILQDALKAKFAKTSKGVAATKDTAENDVSTKVSRAPVKCGEKEVAIDMSPGVLAEKEICEQHCIWDAAITHAMQAIFYCI
jgi:hypothetical protein